MRAEQLTGNTSCMTLGWAIGIGLLVGLAARLIFKRHRIGVLKSLAIGVGGALLGWWAGRAWTEGATRSMQILSALLGATIALLVVHIIASRRRIFGRRRFLWRGHLTKRAFRT